MLFNSLEFLLFLPVVLGIYYLIPGRYRWTFLLFASYVFYAGWKLNYLGLILFSTVLDFFVGKTLSITTIQWKRNFLLATSLVGNFSMLILFKYFHFLIGGSSWFKNAVATSDHVLWLQFIFEYGIPVGISFYTFQTVSYTVDVYRRRIEPEKNIGKFALFVTFFPQLVAGPIERFSNLHEQLFQVYKPTLATFRKAFQLILLGFFLKMTIADNIAPIISPIFDTPENFSIAQRWLGVVLFGIQIYSDFHGYTLIAIGIASLFGIQLMYNFNSPYSAISLKEFWSKWHISLSTWFRDYIYIPLGGKKNQQWKWLLAILLTFGLSGLWHGAAVNFIYWGLLHGVFYLLEQRFFPVKKETKLKKLNRYTRWLLTMFIVFFGWLLFRIDRMRKVKHFFQLKQNEITEIQLDNLLLIPLFIFILLEYKLYTLRFDSFLSPKPVFIRWTIYLLLLGSLALFSNTGNFQFIYFQF